MTAEELAADLTRDPSVSVRYGLVDHGAYVLTLHIRERDPFVFVRYGDGAIEAILGKPGHTCDGEVYTPALGTALLAAWKTLTSAQRCYVGDWLAASFSGANDPSRYEPEFIQLLSRATRRPFLLHPECLLLMRESPTLRSFYRAAQEDPRPKLYLGPAENHGAARMLGAAHVVSPMAGNLLAETGRLTDACLKHDFEVFYWSCGMAGSVVAARLFGLRPDRSYVNLGSALDPLFRGRSRTQQLSTERARAFMKELL